MGSVMGINKLHQFITTFNLIDITIKNIAINTGRSLTGSAVNTHDVTTGTGYCLVGFNWIIDFLN